MTPDEVREAAEAVLADPSYARNARQFHDEIAAMPAPAEAVARLEAIRSAART